MKQKNLDAVNLARRYKRKRYSKSLKRFLCGEKALYDCVGIAKEIKRTQKRDIDPRSVSRFLYRAEGDIKRGLRRGRFLKGKYLGKKIVVQFNRVLGNVFGEGGFNNLSKAVWRLALAGENLEDHSRDLCRKYRLPVDCIKEQWDEDQEYFGKLPAQEIEALRNQEYLKPLPWKVRQYWKELQAEQRKQRGQKSIIENRFEKPGREISPEEYKKRFGHSLDPGEKDEKEFEARGWKRIRPGAKVFISSGPSPSLASSVPRKAKEKTAEAQPH